MEEIIWKKEDIPNEAILYCYVFKNNINKENKKPLEKAFQNTPIIGGVNLSSDWNEYSTPQETRARLATQKNSKGVPKNPEDFFVVQLEVDRIRKEIITQKVEHDPIQKINRAHSIIIGEKTVEARLKLVDICTWAISPFEP